MGGPGCFAAFSDMQTSPSDRWQCGLGFAPSCLQQPLAPWFELLDRGSLEGRSSKTAYSAKLIVGAVISKMKCTIRKAVAAEAELA
jgi:hypothetical protein